VQQCISEVVTYLQPGQYGYAWACQLVRDDSVPSLMSSRFYPNPQQINSLAIEVHYHSEGAIECIVPEGYLVLQNIFRPPPFDNSLVNWVTFKGRRYTQIPLIYQSQEFYRF